MARDANSLWSPLPESGSQGTGTKTQFIVHSTGDRGTAESVFNYFARPDVVVESTFIVGLSPADPTRQILDSSEVADANLTANVRAISVEVVGTEFDDYTDWQVSEIIRLARFAMANHPILPRVCPGPSDSGFGWHVMFGSPGPWTPVAKSCPGALRIQRLNERVFPAIFADPSGGFLMALNDDQQAQLYNWMYSVQGVLGSLNAYLQQGGEGDKVLRDTFNSATQARNAALALLSAGGSGVPGKLSNDELSSIAKAVADEQARRLTPAATTN